jgi:hypothetical protein
MQLVHEEDKSFGNKALTNDEPRSARLLTKTPCHMMIVSKHDFTNCLAKF